ncbi:hypothetical protein [uncultured Chryseobacterium sp.]|uniref:hypothetical protein n=1 Tax=uncultured Chryseobacterium sp. TaxID=259322 RepID=UPI0025E5F4CE|nr:hypothetical protein [uncultured Chryseobacterium sp.]
MAYSIIAKKKDGTGYEIPISTHSLFHDYWLPLFEKNKLENLSNWKFPHDFEKEELKKIIEEWEKLLPYIKEDWEKERAKFIISKLKEIKFEDFEYINFG